MIFTVNAWLLGSQLRVAIPFGTCFSVALAVVALAVGVDVVEDGGVGGVAEPPQEARSQTKAMLSNAKLEAVRLINYEYLSFDYLYNYYTTSYATWRRMAKTYSVTMITPFM